MKLNLGCGVDWRDHVGFDGVDIVDFSQKYVIDIEKDGLMGIPDESVDEIRAYNFLEHIALGRTVFVMNECWRVMAHGGIFDIKVPKFPHDNAVADPTHKSFWVVKTFTDYFCGGSPRNADYQIKKWAITNDGKGNYRMEVTDRQIHILLYKK